MEVTKTKEKANTVVSQAKIDEKVKAMFDEKIYDEKNSKYYGFLIKQIEAARIQRDTPYKFFDDQTYVQAYLSNQDAANTYLQKKKNTTEIRVNTGSTEKKIETTFNELLSLNIKSKIYSFDDNDTEMVELGQAYTNMVRRSNQIENDEEFWSDFVHELLTQPSVFIYENYISKIVYDKRKTDKQGNKLIKYKRNLCQKQVLSGLQVYLGDITKPARLFQEQPYIVIHEEVSWSEAYQMFSDNPNWTYVKEGRTGANANLFDYKLLEGVSNSAYEQDKISIIHYLNAPDDEYNCLVNGVMMFEAGTKLPYEKEGYNMEMIVIKSMSRNFAYGKSLVQSAKYLQAIDNEAIRLFIRKFRQDTNPPVGVKKGRVLSKDLFEPGTFHQGVTKDSFERLIDHNGISNSDTAFMTIVEEKIKEFIGTNDLMSGQESKGSMTATEIVRLQRQALKMLGLSVNALRRAHAKADMLRLYNILENETKPIKKILDEVKGKTVDIFKKYSLSDAELPNGKRGTYHVQFTNREFTPEDKQQIYLKQKDSEERGKPEKYMFINVDTIRKIPYYFYAIANSEQDKGGELDKALFSEQLNQAAGIVKITGRKLNSNKVIENFERTWGVEDMFMEEGQEMMNAEGNPELGELDQQIADMESGKVATQIKQPVAPQPTPSVNTLAK